MDLDDSKKLNELVKRRHPEYLKMLPHWLFLQDTYRGGRDWFEHHIFQYIKEGDGEFKERKLRAYRFNHTREIVDLVNKYIFKGEIIRNVDDASNAVEEFWKKSTRNSLNIDQYMRQISSKSSTVGRIWVVVDNTNQDSAVKSIADEKKAGVRTFSYIVMPEHVLDMSYDGFGDLNWILINELSRNDEDPTDDAGDITNNYRLWTRTGWYLFEEKRVGRNKIEVSLSKSGEHNLNVVPVFSVDHIDTDAPYSAAALIGDIAYLDRAVANYLSNLDAIIQDQTFSQLAMPAQSLLPGDEGFEKLVEMGTKRMFTYDGESGNKPFYLSPDPKQAELIIMAIQKIINEIYHSVGMAGERTKSDNSAGIDNSSGVAKAYDFERVNALLSAKADSLDRAEEKLTRLVDLWNGNTPSEESLVKYPADFDVRGLYDEFDIAERLDLVAAPDSVRRQHMEMLIEKLFPRLKVALKEKMITDLNSWPPVVDLGNMSDLSDEDEDKDDSSNSDGS